MDNVQIGIIGGSGLYDMADVSDRREVALETPFGDPSSEFVTGTLEGKEVVFLARHDKGHRILPSEINYRANIYGMKALGVEASAENVCAVIAVTAQESDFRVDPAVPGLAALARKG